MKQTPVEFSKEGGKKALLAVTTLPTRGDVDRQLGMSPPLSELLVLLLAGFEQSPGANENGSSA
jgi:hypothetical protein